MIGTHNEPGFRTIAIIGLLQIGVVVFGTAFVSVALKGAGYGLADMPDQLFTSPAVLVRNWGFLLLCLPAIWVALSLLIVRKRKAAWIQVVMNAFGVAAAVYGIWLYFELCLNAV